MTEGREGGRQAIRVRAVSNSCGERRGLCQLRGVKYLQVVFGMTHFWRQ